MKGKLLLPVNGIKFTSSEAIYHALKFPENSEIQSKIAIEKSPMTAKRIAQSYSFKIRSDWEDIKVCAMRIALRIKALECEDFYKLLLSTNPKEIVEISRKDDFWGTYSYGEKLVGKNVLGRLLMELRNEKKRCYYSAFKCTA